jgi:hypothetical protein
VAPFRSIVAASRAAQPGTVVHVGPGFYEGGFVTTASGTADSPVRYLSDVKWGAKIVPPASSSYDMAWDNRGASVIIDGFEVDGSRPQRGTPWRLGIYTAGTASVVQNNSVHHIAIAAACADQGGAGIEGDSYNGATGIDVIGNVLHDIGQEDCAYVHGIYQTAPGRIANNLVYGVSGWAIHLWHDARQVAIVNNTVFNSNAGGILVGGGGYVNTNGPADHVLVAYNIVFDNAGIGISEHGDTGTHNLFTHNLSHRNRSDWRLRTSAPDPAAVSADPGFVNYLREGGGDYRLAPGSPAIGACAPEYAPATDLDGLRRPQRAACDIGAYQAAAPP